jgi:predicted Zn-dependent protease
VDRDLLYTRAWLARAQGSANNEALALEELISQFPNEARAYVQLGRLLIDLGKRREALELLRGGAARHPHIPEIRRRLVEVYEAMGLKDEAKKVGEADAE